MANLTEILSSLPVGFTRVVGPTVVTRWGADTYEVGTWGKQTLGAFDAAAAIARADSLDKGHAWAADPVKRINVGCHAEIAAFVGGLHFVVEVSWGVDRSATWTLAHTAAAAVEQARAVAGTGHETFVLTAPGRVIEVHDPLGRLVHHTHTIPASVRRLVAHATAA